MWRRGVAGLNAQDDSWGGKKGLGSCSHPVMGSCDCYRLVALARVPKPFGQHGALEVVRECRRVQRRLVAPHTARLAPYRRGPGQSAVIQRTPHARQTAWGRGYPKTCDDGNSRRGPIENTHGGPHLLDPDGLKFLVRVLRQRRAAGAMRLQEGR